MAKGQQRGGGGRLAGFSASGTVPKQIKHPRNSGVRLSPRPPLVTKRVSTGRESTIRGGRQTGARSQRDGQLRRTDGKSDHSRATNDTQARRGSRSESGGPRMTAGANLGSGKSGEVPDKGEKALRGLRDGLEKDLQTAIGQAETDCSNMVSEAAEKSSGGTIGKEADQKAAQRAVGEVESLQASLVAGCSDMLKALASHGTALEGLARRYSTALDNIGQSESRKLKSSFDRILSA